MPNTHQPAGDVDARHGYTGGNLNQGQKGGTANRKK
jgi:hypothetical protein